MLYILQTLFSSPCGWKNPIMFFFLLLVHCAKWFTLCWFVNVATFFWLMWLLLLHMCCIPCLEALMVKKNILHVVFHLNFWVECAKWLLTLFIGWCSMPFYSLMRQLLLFEVANFSLLVVAAIFGYDASPYMHWFVPYNLLCALLASLNHAMLCWLVEFCI